MGVGGQSLAKAARAGSSASPELVVLFAPVLLRWLVLMGDILVKERNGNREAKDCVSAL